MMLIRDWEMKENTQICECNITVGSSDHKLIVLNGSSKLASVLWNGEKMPQR